jgi:hypothetical protein
LVVEVENCHSISNGNYLKYFHTELLNLGKLFQIQISDGDNIQFESGNMSIYYMLSATAMWDEKKSGRIMNIDNDDNI